MVVRTGGVNKVDLVLGELYAIHPDPPQIHPIQRQSSAHGQERHCLPRQLLLPQ